MTMLVYEFINLHQQLLVQQQLQQQQQHLRPLKQ